MERLKLSCHRSLLDYFPIELLQIDKWGFSILSVSPLSFVMLDHDLDPIIPLPQHDTMPRVQIFSLSYLPIIPPRSQPPLPAFHKHFLHLFLEVLPNTPNTDIHSLPICVKTHLYMVVTKFQTSRILLNWGETFNWSDLPVKPITLRLRNQ